MNYPFHEVVVFVEGLIQHVDEHIDEGGAGDVAARVDGEVVGAERLERLGARLEHLGVCVSLHQVLDGAQRRVQTCLLTTRTRSGRSAAGMPIRLVTLSGSAQYLLSSSVGMKSAWLCCPSPT